MTPYLAVFSVRFQALLQYRVAALAGLVTQVFWGFIRVMIFTAFYRSAPAGAAAGAAAPMALPDVVSYVWLGQALLMLILWRPEPDLVQMGRTGNVAYELLKPVDLYGLWYAREVAARVAPTLLRAIPLLALAYLFFGLGPPASPASLVAFAGALCCAVLLSAAFSTIATIVVVRTVSGRGAVSLLTGLLWIFSGMILPLPLFPDWAQPVLAVLPFRGLMDAPFRLYLGHIPPAGALPVVVHQLVWTLLLVGAGRALLARFRRRLVIQGG